MRNALKTVPGVLAAAVLAAMALGKTTGGSKAPETTTRPTAPAKAGLRELKLKLPEPRFEGTPPDLKKHKVRPPTDNRRIMVPEGLDLKNVALNKPVTGSNEEPTLGELELVTDGDTEAEDGSHVELGPGVQWVQVDLQSVHEIHVILLWHYHAEARIYHDVVVQVCDDKDFITGVRTLFNNDHDNSAGLGVGKDLPYIEDFRGEAIQPRKPVRARYVRLYSNGNTSNDLNQYTEVEIYGTLKE